MNKPKNRAFAATNWAVGEMDQLFIAFARYTRFVLFSKWFLGVCAVLMLAGLIAWPLLSKDTSGMRISFASKDVGAPQPVTSPVMEAPHFIGSDKKNQQYSITGTRATQVTPQLVQVENAQGQLVRVDGSSTSMRADVALYHQDTKMVELSGNVTVVDSKGTTFVTSQATINADTMDADGTEPVEGNSPSGKLVATGFKIRDSGNAITFGNGSRVNVHIEKMRQNK